jgi:hypothetical protein
MVRWSAVHTRIPQRLITAVTCGGSDDSFFKQGNSKALPLLHLIRISDAPGHNDSGRQQSLVLRQFDKSLVGGRRACI